MTRIAPWHFEATTTASLDLIRRLGRRPWAESLHLAGGTACALHFGHRLSLDVDLFSSSPFAPEPYRRYLSEVGKTTVRSESTGTLHAEVDRVRVSILHFPYRLLDRAATVHGLAVAGRRDLAAMKLSSISQRGARRDFVDLFVLCHRGRITLPRLLAIFTRKFRGVRFNEAHLLRSLTYFVDAEGEPMPRMLVPFQWREVRAFFEAEVRAHLQRRIGAGAPAGGRGRAGK